MKTLTLFELYKRLSENLDVDRSWPASCKLEIVLGAILVQNTNWKNVEISLKNLFERTGFDGNLILGLLTAELEGLIRPSGFFVNKAKCIQETLQFLVTYDFDFVLLASDFGSELRKSLLKIRGIGDETADVLLLYVFDQKVFISDKYASKLLEKVGVFNLKNYKSIAEKIKLTEEFTLEQAQEFHILIIEFGQRYLNRGKTHDENFLTGYELKVETGGKVTD